MGRDYLANTGFVKNVSTEKQPHFFIKFLASIPGTITILVIIISLLFFIGFLLTQLISK